MWQGNPDFWSGQDPILFPIIGRLLNDKYTLNGKEYSMPKHGLVRKQAFSLIEKKNDEMTFLITADDNTRAAYPFEFELYVNYILIDRNLEV